MGLLFRAVVVSVGMAVAREVVRYVLDRHFETKDADTDRGRSDAKRRGGRARK
ncbi:hypothetical protein [Glycomyces sp. NRRL B-16210]|uniref:hypothetical protein n=1 Tax=Glycomyces sp. NRRL B-16210 TaxID=1463821 RepID=UPI000A9741F0|nr:hypothetical protein [Glycomyces sp. NRRL B-16210]